MIKITKSSQYKQHIPDNSDTGLVENFTVNQKGQIKDINFSVNIEHPFIGDLQVALTSPSGKKVILHNRKGSNTKNLMTTFNKESLKDMLDTKANGKWKLEVKDFAPRDNGHLVSWSLDMKCAANNHNSEIEIPEKEEKGLQSVQHCRFKGKVTDINVMVDIQHPFVSDLKVQLIAPSGKAVALHNRQGGRDKNLKKTYKGDMLKELIGEKTHGKWTLQMNDYAPKDKGTLRHWKVSFKYQEVDDLKKVEGIGPKIESLLNADGILSFKMLSASGIPRLRRILTEAGDRFKMHNPASWPDQAKMAAEGRWKELEKWQDEHDGGRLN